MQWTYPTFCVTLDLWENVLLSCDGALFCSCLSSACHYTQSQYEMGSYVEILMVCKCFISQLGLGAAPSICVLCNISTGNRNLNFVILLMATLINFNSTYYQFFFQCFKMITSLTIIQKSKFANIMSVNLTILYQVAQLNSKYMYTL